MRALLLAAVVLFGCTKPEPVGPESTPAQIHDACEAGDLDACSLAAHMRSSQYELAMSIN